MDLHGQIMNLRTRPASEVARELEHHNNVYAHKVGHKDARHQAAELVLKFDAERQEMLELLSKCLAGFQEHPRSLGYDSTHVPDIVRMLQKHNFYKQAEIAAKAESKSKVALEADALARAKAWPFPIGPKPEELPAIKPPFGPFPY